MMSDTSIYEENQIQDDTTTQEVPPWRPEYADKEFVRQSIRDRVRNAKISDKAIFIPANPTPTINDTDNKRVAVYARVSTKSTEQVSSIENQTRYYTEKIEKNPNWTMHEIYSDEGKSGTSMRKRTEFKRMLKDAEEQKMDLIICASVSRFARNVADCIEQVGRLRTMNPSHPVGVYFETENIFTLDPEIESKFQIYALFADWESQNKSRRMLLSYDQRICTGQFPLANLLGMRYTKEGDFIIEEDEAKTVRYIFLAYINGQSCEEIAKTLTEKKRKTLKGRTEWNGSMVRAIMSNERRWGDLQVRKTTVIDYKSGKVVKNNKIRDAVFIPNNHTGIVSPEIARAAQMISSSAKIYNGAVPQIYVIEEGSLKGFVSINPLWNGISNDVLKDISKGVYTDTEYEQLERDSRIIQGKEHSNVLSMKFTGYEMPHGVVFSNRNNAMLTLSDKTIGFNSATIKKLESPRFVEVLYHPFLEVIAIRKCDESHPNAVEIQKENGNIKKKFTAKAFADSIYEKTGWYHEYKFKFRGIAKKRGNSNVVFFFLDEPQILVDKTKREQDTISEIQDCVKYIEYKNSKDAETDSNVKVAYPNAWQNNTIGVSYAINKRRNFLVDTIAEKDIKTIGLPVDNPLIGSIPTRDEVKEELEKLLACM